jgi:hypothetical protein
MCHTFLIHVHSSSFIMHSFSLTVNNHKCIPFVHIHTMPSGGLLQPVAIRRPASLGCAKSIGEVTHLPSLGYAKTVGRASCN